MTNYRNKSIFILSAILLLVTASQSIAAENYLHMFGGVGAGYYYLYPKDNQIKDFYKGGIVYRGFMGFKADSGLSAVGDISYYSEGNRSALAPYGTALTIIPITASVAYRFFKDSAFNPYLGAGIGIYNINESDPDFTYLQTTKFGKHIFAGADFYLDRNTVLQAELRQTIIDPINSSLYYQASLGGITATVNIAIEWPLAGKTPMTTQEAALELQKSLAYNEHLAIMNRMNEIDSYYDQRNWNRNMYYRPWNTPDIYINTVVQPTQQQIDAQKAQEARYKAEQDKKRQEYLDQKQQLRQDKKDSLTKPSR
ncbi:MAG: porin family protein [Candidatus Margulisiibacteriota bacterium]